MNNIHNLQQCKDKLKKLHGLAPYNTGMNPCLYDGYFAASIERDFTPETIAQAEKELNVRSPK